MQKFLVQDPPSGIVYSLAIGTSFITIDTNEIPGELSRENISSGVKRSPLLWLHNKSRRCSMLGLQKNKVKWFGISLVFI